MSSFQCDPEAAAINTSSSKSPSVCLFFSDSAVEFAELKFLMQQASCHHF
jgi:hypothetical protein